MQKLKDYSQNFNNVYVNEIIVDNLCSLPTNTIVKDSNFITSPDVKISGKAVTIIRLFKFTSSANSQVIFSQSDASNGISIKTDSNGDLFVTLNGDTLFASKNINLKANKVYALSLTFNGSYVNLNVNRERYLESIKELYPSLPYSVIVESNSDMIANFTGHSGVLLCTNVLYKDADRLVDKIYYLATHYRILSSSNALVGVGTADDGVMPVNTAEYYYMALPISILNSIDFATIKNDIIGVISDNKYLELSYKTAVISIEADTTNSKITVNGKTVIYGDGLFRVMFANPASGRVLGYTRIKNASDYTHKFYVDSALVDTITSTDEFIKSTLCDIPIEVDGNKISITPSKYIIDDLIIDDKEYIESQFRSFRLADELVDDLNEKTITASVAGFSNQIIYSVDDSNLPEDLQELADANSDIKKIAKFTDN